MLLFEKFLIILKEFAAKEKLEIVNVRGFAVILARPRINAESNPQKFFLMGKIKIYVRPIKRI